ncbi:hypothetical protein HU200_061617 [Digitaria exilis]|uniref:Peptidase A1 domain-containing protein n=1 Tax=Digitaria exilis TaxID=1010633 RepID=A0A835AGZ1_9POAL|nr:hypothetical protein HU200_061617 [Digitaria exilis]
MTLSTFIFLLVPILASLAATGTTNASFDLRAELNHPYAGIRLSKHEMIRNAAIASKARRAWNAARVTKLASGHGGTTTVSSPPHDVRVTPLKSFHTLTMGVGTPPQPHTLLIDTGSDLVWLQCKPFGGEATATDPLYDPYKSSSFATVPCDGELCQEGNFQTTNCSKNKCLYTYAYGQGRTFGELASDIFTLGVHHKVPASLDFGCAGELMDANIYTASGFLGFSPDKLSFVSQLQIPRFSYCLTPFTDRKSGQMFFGSMADLYKYRTTGPVQTTALLNDQIGSNTFYYVSLIGISFGTKRLSIPASSLTGTFVDSGYTTGALTVTALDALKEALDFCFQLPRGVAFETVKAPPLLYHFEGGATMVLPRDNYLVEVSTGEMCLVIGEDDRPVIGNFQQQNMHLLFDVQNQKFSFAPTQCGHI